MNTWIFHLLAIALSTIGIYTWIKWSVINPLRMLLVISPISVLIHTIIFSITSIVLKNSYAVFLSQWNLILALHLVYTIVIGGYAMLALKKPNGNTTH